MLTRQLSHTTQNRSRFIPISYISCTNTNVRPAPAHDVVDFRHQRHDVEGSVDNHVVGERSARPELLVSPVHLADVGRAVRIISSLVPSRLVSFHGIPSRLVPSHPVLRSAPLRSIPFRHIPSRPVPSRPVPSRLVPFCPVVSATVPSRSPPPVLSPVSFSVPVLYPPSRLVLFRHI